MTNDISQRVPQAFYTEKIESDRRNAEIAYWLYRSCTPGTPEFNRAQLLKTSHGITSREYIVWDVLPKNALKDSAGDVYIIDAEITFCH